MSDNKELEGNMMVRASPCEIKKYLTFASAIEQGVNVVVVGII